MSVALNRALLQHWPMPRDRVRALSILLFWFAFGAAAEPSKFTPPPAEYTWQTWTREHGVPMGRIQSILQTRDGYLWVGTSAGIARFDGRQWQVFNRANTPELPADGCSQLVEDLERHLWAHFKDRLVRWNGSTFKSFDWPEPPEHKPVLNVCAS